MIVTHITSVNRNASLHLESSVNGRDAFSSSLISIRNGSDANSKYNYRYDIFEAEKTGVET